MSAISQRRLRLRPSKATVHRSVLQRSKGGALLGLQAVAAASLAACLAGLVLQWCLQSFLLLEGAQILAAAFVVRAAACTLEVSAALGERSRCTKTMCVRQFRQGIKRSADNDKKAEELNGEPRKRWRR
mmetsp:Transcript_59355/g.139034  ORF Transcript_59355/g.139034 Transcript_59355/m.139034 type:complete len:129 (-) Transcript_59355:127-513(-)|eukprot:s872_g14.t1